LVYHDYGAAPMTLGHGETRDPRSRWSARHFRSSLRPLPTRWFPTPRLLARRGVSWRCLAIEHGERFEVRKGEVEISRLLNILEENTGFKSTARLSAIPEDPHGVELARLTAAPGSVGKIVLYSPHPNMGLSWNGGNYPKMDGLQYKFLVFVVFFGYGTPISRKPP
jgi:hypothetical protein